MTPSGPIVLCSRIDALDDMIRFYSEFGFTIEHLDALSGRALLRADNQDIELTPVDGALIEGQTGLSFHFHNLSGFLSHMVESHMLPENSAAVISNGTARVEDPAGNIIQLIEAGHA